MVPRHMLRCVFNQENLLNKLIKRTVTYNKFREKNEGADRLNSSKKNYFDEKEREIYPGKMKPQNYIKTTRPVITSEREPSITNISRFKETEESLEAELMRYSYEEQMEHLHLYTPKIEKLLNESKFEEAFQIFEEHIVKDGRVRPTAYLYNLFIGYLGRLGDVNGAFTLYRQMTDRDLKCDESTFTSLFNACANSAEQKFALRKAIFLREKLKRKNYIPNSTNYNAMIKAFGRCNDLETTFEVADEMLSEGHSMDAQMLSFLLMACASDREAGFIHALKVWQRFHKKMHRLSDIYNFNLLLRVIRDCGVGKIEDSLKTIVDNSKSYPQLKSSSDSSNSLIKIDVALEQVKKSSSLQLASDRLSILGNVEGFLSHMARSNVKPDIKTISLLLEIIPSNVEQENQLMESMKEYGVDPDIDFFNLLMKRRNFRNDLSGALEVIEIINEFNLTPDIVTFGVLALGCKTRLQCIELLKAIEDAGFRPNQQILTPLIRSSCYRHDWDFIAHLLEVVSEEEIEFNERLIKIVELGVKRTKEKIVEAEISPNKLSITPSCKAAYQRFLPFYQSWMKKVPFQFNEN